MSENSRRMLATIENAALALSLDVVQCVSASTFCLWMYGVDTLAVKAMALVKLWAF